MTNTTELMPCPFCAGDAYTDEQTAATMGKKTGWNFAIACSNCGSVSMGYPTFDGAVDEWNTRHTPEQDEYVTRLEELAASVRDCASEDFLQIEAEDILAERHPKNRTAASRGYITREQGKRELAAAGMIPVPVELLERLVEAHELSTVDWDAMRELEAMITAAQEGK